MFERRCNGPLISCPLDIYLSTLIEIQQDQIDFLAFRSQNRVKYNQLYTQTPCKAVFVHFVDDGKLVNDQKYLLNIYRAVHNGSCTPYIAASNSRTLEVAKLLKTGFSHCTFHQNRMSLKTNLSHMSCSTTTCQCSWFDNLPRHVMSCFLNSCEGLFDECTMGEAYFQWV